MTASAEERYGTGEFAVHRTTVHDPLAAGLRAELAHEYRSRYGTDSDLHRYPAAEFAPPHGTFLLLLEGGTPVAGGAYRRYDPTTAELKRIWTHSAHRRRGMARRVLHVLEKEASNGGYRRIYLTTGRRQPEARALYLAAGYRPLFDLTADPETLRRLPFEKHLTEHPTAPGERPHT